MKKLSTRSLIVGVLLVVFCSVALGSWAKTRYQDRQSVLYDLEVFAKVVEKIKSFYVEDVDTHELVTDAIEKMLRELDPHSQFLSGLDYEDLMLSTQGEFGGLGIFISFRDNYPTVISPIEDTPAGKAGIQGGDRIVEIEGQSTEGWQVEKAVRHLRGDPGSPVSFKISRPGLREPIDYSLVREVIKVSSVTYSGMFDDVGYVKVSNFSKQTHDELEDALEELERDGMNCLVLDLRSNPGGLLQAATSVSELFLEKDRLVVYTKGRYPQSNQKYYSNRNPKHAGYPIVVMVNGASASASEIVAGALQDWDAGFVVGQTTFGKGTVQTVFSLTETEAVKLTTAKYYTPSGRSIHRDELESDADAQTAGGSDGADDDYASVDNSGGDEPVSTEGAAVRPIYHTASGRVVYGGGGIAPDLEFEPQKYEEIERRLERDGLFFSFAIDYSTKHKVTRDIKITDDVIAEFKKLLADREFEYEDENFAGSRDYINKALLRELISKNFGRKEMYRVLLELDPEFQEVRNIFKKATSLEQMFEYAEEQQALKKASLQ